MNDSFAWWQQAIIYQLLVPSYQDTDGNGVGDLPGVIARLDYLKWLGVDTLWLCPIYPSPMVDLGYDITDHVNVHPQFGTLDDFDYLVEEAHRRNIRVLLDWVPNHTSDHHPWFIESRSSRSSAKRDWYLWKDPQPDGSPPNNWISVFGGSVWAWDPQTEQFYCHTFSERQPDLNWRNPEVQQAMMDTLHFWLKRGLDGFRIDATCLLIKDAQFRNNPVNPGYKEGDAPDNRLIARYTRDQPEVHKLLAWIRREVEEYGDDRVLLGELYLPIEKVVTYYGSNAPEVHLPLNVTLAFTDWDPAKIGPVLEQYERYRPPDGWPAWMISTHDCLRVAARVPGEQARVAAMLLMTLPGTVIHYYGEEVGMHGVPIPPERAIDPQGRGTGRNRDPERTPMQWDGSRYGGFSSVKPWLPVGSDLASTNVAAQWKDPRSLLNLYRRLIALRREETVLVGGERQTVLRHAPLLTYLRRDEQQRLFVVLNLGQDSQRCKLESASRGRILLSTYLDREDERVQEHIDLRPDEGVIVKL